MIQSRLIRNETMLRRRNAKLGQYGEDGFPVDDQFTECSFIGNAQPINGREILQVPEGDRESDNMWLYTEADIRPNDVVVRQGVQYEVRTAEDWRQQRLRHVRCRMVRRDV